MNRRTPAEIYTLDSIRQAEDAYWDRVRASIQQIMKAQAKRREQWRLDNG